MNRKGFTPLIVVLIVAAVFAVGVLGYLAWKSLGTLPQNPNVQTQVPLVKIPSTVAASTTQSAVATTTPSSTVDTPRWTAYRNNEYGISLQYPSSWNTITQSNNPFMLTLSSYSKTQYVHGLGIPNRGGLEVDVAQGTLPICSNVPDDFVLEADQAGIGLQPYNKWICDGLFTVSLWYTDDATNPLPISEIAADKQLLNSIAATFKDFSSQAPSSTTIIHDSVSNATITIDTAIYLQNSVITIVTSSTSEQTYHVKGNVSVAEYRAGNLYVSNQYETFFNEKAVGGSSYPSFQYIEQFLQYSTASPNGKVLYATTSTNPTLNFDVSPDSNFAAVVDGSSPIQLVRFTDNDRLIIIDLNSGQQKVFTGNDLVAQNVLATQGLATDPQLNYLSIESPVWSPDSSYVSGTISLWATSNPSDEEVANSSFKVYPSTWNVEN